MSGFNNEIVLLLFCEIRVALLWVYFGQATNFKVLAIDVTVDWDRPLFTRFHFEPHNII